MQVVFLCGGVGSRMAPLSGDKSGLKFLGKTLLDHQVETALAAGLSEFVVVANRQNADSIGDILQRYTEARVGLAVQTGPSGMAGALRAARHLMEGQAIVVSVGDVVDGSAYQSVLSARGQVSATSYLLGTKVERYFPGGYLVVDSDGEIRRIVEKPGAEAGPSDVVTIVVHLHSDVEALFHHLTDESCPEPDSYERALQAMVDDGRSLRYVEYGGSWVPMKYPWHVLAAMKHFLDRARGHIAASAVISERATIEGEVIADEGARVLEGAVVRGPCYIGRDSVIGNHVLVRDYAHIGADCVVGAGTEMKNSYVGDGCWFHRNYIGDSVVGNHCSLGAGTVTANLRFDGGEVSVYDDGDGQDTGMGKLGAMIGSGSKTGVNVSIMPGVKIGPGSVVGPHVLVRRNVAPNSTLSLSADGAVVEMAAGAEEGETEQVL